MIKHCVFVQFKPEVTDAQRQALYEKLEALKAYVTGWVGFTAGANVTPEVGMDKGFNGGFIIDFADEAAHHIYLGHPEHLVVAKQLVEAASEGVDGIMVFDFKL